jgi:FixJ family two-component response regulator
MSADAETVLLSAIEDAFRLHRQRRAERSRAECYRVRLGTLSEREFEVLRHVIAPLRACVVADVRCTGTEGAGLPRLLAARGIQAPVIFLTAEDSAQMRAEAKRSGAAAYFRKPVDDQALLDAIAWVMRQERIGRGTWPR